MKITSKNRLTTIFTLFGLFFLSYTIRGQEEISKSTSQFIEVDGFNYHYKMAGKEHLANNVPVVIFESGAFGDLNNWNSIFDIVSEFAPVLTYSRSGIGKSDWNNIEPTAYNSAIQLDKLIQKLELHSSFVLVGHSWGGAIIRAYAGHFPDNVKALIFVEPIDFMQSKEQADEVYINIGVDPIEADKFHSESLKFMMTQFNAPKGVIPEIEALDKFYKQDLKERKLGPNPNKPMALLLGTKEFDNYPPTPEGFVKPWKDDHQWFKSQIKNRIKYLSKWPFMFNDCYIIISPNATHHFQVDEPELVVDMIKKFI